jgi:hypothetical protein
MVRVFILKKPPSCAQHASFSMAEYIQPLNLIAADGILFRSPGNNSNLRVARSFIQVAPAMLNKKVIIPVVAAILVALGVNLEQFGIDLNQLAGGNSNTSDVSRSNQSSGDTAAYQSGPKWSSTTPAINLPHVFEGEINRKGKPVGYHSRPGGRDAPGARIVSMRDGPNSKGVYTANIEIQDGGQWKQKFSSFFPDSMSQQQVIDAIINAYSNSNNKKSQPWQGPSGHGFDIQGYTLSKGDINTAFPVYRRD